MRILAAAGAHAAASLISAEAERAKQIALRPRDQSHAPKERHGQPLFKSQPARKAPRVVGQVFLSVVLAFEQRLRFTVILRCERSEPRRVRPRRSGRLLRGSTFGRAPQDDGYGSSFSRRGCIRVFANAISTKAIPNCRLPKKEGGGAPTGASSPEPAQPPVPPLAGKHWETTRRAPRRRSALAFRRSTAVKRRRFYPSTRSGPRFLEPPDADGRTLSGTSAASTSQTATWRPG
jgi:hypothetical protein